MGSKAKIALFLVGIGDVALLIVFLTVSDTLTGAGMVILSIGIGVLSFLTGVLAYLIWTRIGTVKKG